MLDKVKSKSVFHCNYTITPYVGCEYGCVYCRKCIEAVTPEKSPDTILIKDDAPNILRKELKSAKKALVCISGYQQVENEKRIIRKTLEILSMRRFPVHIITRSDIVLEDIDILRKIAEDSWCAVSFCINTLDEAISHIFEPHAPSPKQRIKALGKVAEAGIPTGIALMPIIPYITDSKEQLEKVISTAADMKAGYALAAPLKLEDEYRARVIQVIKRHFSKLLARYRKMYEFGPLPDVRYSRELKRKIRPLLDRYDLPEGIEPTYNLRKTKQVRIENY
ncbi:MAG: radical SAM protein [Methanomassiliicoccales archaeon]|nr:MAG: radical SAM protein [Methanomassiliicoccales archaeon]